MRNMFYKAAAGAMAATMVMSLAACGGSGKDGGSAANGNGGEAEGPITGQTLQVMISEEPGEGDALGNALKNGLRRPAMRSNRSSFPMTT